MKDNENDKKIKELNSKIVILIKALKEEKSNSSKYKSEIDQLKNELMKKNESLEQCNILNHFYKEKENNNDPQKYFNNLMENTLNKQVNNNNTKNQETIEKLKEENEELNKNIKVVQEYSENLVQKCEKLEGGIEELNNKISLLNEEIKIKNEIIQQKEEKLIILNGYLNNENIIKNEVDSKILRLTNELDKYKYENETLKKQNSMFLITIEELKNQIEKKGRENYNLEKEINEKKEINFDDYIFKGVIQEFSIDGVIHKNLFKSFIIIFFNKYPNKISIKLDKFDLAIKINDVIKVDYHQNKKNKLIILINIDKKMKSIIEGREIEDDSSNSSEKESSSSDEDESEEESEEECKKKQSKDGQMKIVGEFTEKECKYIKIYYNDLLEKYNEQTKKLFMTTMNLEDYD